jgi:arylsulfatase/uncharacterized sulfatase
MIMRTLGTLGTIAAIMALFAAPALAQQPQARPNIVLILADDVGFTDFGAYGGEARTPNIDALAARGARFSRYYTSPLCSPSRAMLLTGLDNHRTGHATIVEVLPPELRNKPGYSMRLEPGVVTVAERLRRGGYRTYVTGKWHLGHGQGDLPDSHGFDRSFVLDASGADNWSERPYMPYYRTADWFENGKRAHLPDDFYSSKFIVDRMIRYLDADGATAREPFFAYLAFQAVHIPVQAPREMTEHYNGVYDAGWEAIRAERWSRTQTLGLNPEGAPPAPAHPSFRTWNSLSGDDRALYARSMQVHAGMIEAMDQHIGRFIAYLESRGLAENTIFIVTSDNGPEPSNPVADRDFVRWMALRGGYTRQLANLGERGSFVFIGPEWANATSAGALYKFTTGEGGLRVPLIIAGPGIAQQRIEARTFVTDIAPTLLERAGVAPDATALDGVSIASVLSRQGSINQTDTVSVGVEVSGHAALYRGDYKLVRTPAPLGDAAWRLYDITRDPGETRDLAGEQPERLADMRAAYDAYAQRVGVQALPEGYDVQQQVVHNVRMKTLEHYWWVLAIAGVVLLALLYGAWRLIHSLYQRAKR